MAKNTFSVKNDMQYLFKPKVSLSKSNVKRNAVHGLSLLALCWFLYSLS